MADLLVSRVRWLVTEAPWNLQTYGCPVFVIGRRRLPGFGGSSWCTQGFGSAAQSSGDSACSGREPEEKSQLIRWNK